LTPHSPLIKITRLVALLLVALLYRSDRGNAMHTMLRLVLACGVLLASTPGMAQTPLERGIAAMEAERFQEAIAILTQALDGRQLKSVEEIGLAYWHRGRAKASLDDCAGAIPDWEEAMALDASPDVYSNLGFCHFRLKQYEEAIPYLGFDAKNFPNAATFTLLGKAQALTDDFDGAEASFRSALELEPDYADAKKGLAAVKELRAERGAGAASSGARPTQTPATPAAEPSVAALRGDCERGSAKACSLLAEKYGTGKGVQKDEAISARLHEQACQGKYLLSCTILGSLYLSGQGVPASVERASAIWRQACDAGEPGSCTMLGVLYELRRKPADPATAAVYYQKGCDGGHGDGCTQLSKLYRSGQGVTQDAARADQLWQLGCKRGSAACKQDQQPAGAKAAATPAAQPANANCKIAGVQLGVDTVASVERDIQARGGSPLTGGSGPAKYRVSTMSGDYQDAGFDPMAVNYDFDAAGPAGRLVAVTIANHANTGPSYETLLASRKAAAAAIAGPLQQKSATELVASGPGCQLRLLPNADTWFIHEVYQLPN
jgi:TPR repeat protein